MQLPSIDLSDTVGLGLIISYPTGILLENQTGGSACLRPQLEGVYLPLANDYNEDQVFLSPEITLNHYFTNSMYKGTGATTGINQNDVVAIHAMLKQHQLYPFITVDSNKLAQSHEAWIWVHLRGGHALLKGFQEYPLNAVLTWANSD
ncbi:MAG: DUF6210 family protein [Aureispira sp.]